MPVLQSDLYHRPDAREWRCPPVGPEVAAFHRALPGYVPTPLVEVPALAAELGADRVFVKDESARMGLPAFKILGASWAVHRALAGARAPELITATDGNHGRAVARMARLSGTTARIFVPAGLPAAALAGIWAEGASIIEVAGSYDEAVRTAARAAEAPGTLLVQDTAWPGYERIPAWIVEGYSTLFTEIDAQLAAADAGPPGLIVVPAGVGSLAQAAITHYRAAAPPPSIATVEPEQAACVLAALRAGSPRPIATGRTVMAGLNCGTVSSLAWPYLRDGLDLALAVTDDACLRAQTDLTALGIPAGPCGAASLAAARLLPPADTVVLLSTEAR